MLRPSLRRLSAFSLFGLVAFSTAVEAMPERPTEGGSIPAALERSEELFAQGVGCSAAAAQAAAQTGGQVLSVRASQQGDRTVCVVTVLIPASDGNRPRRQTITIEQ